MPKRNPIIRVGVDADGVIWDFIKAYVRMIRKLHGPVLPSDFKPDRWNGFELSHDEETEVWRHIDDDPNFWANLDVYPESAKALVKYVPELLAQDVQVYIVTARGVTGKVSAEHQTRLALAAINDELESLPVLVTQNFASKYKVYEALNFSFSVDDYAPSVLSANSLKRHKAYLMLQPWNRTEAFQFDLPAVTSLDEFFKHVMPLEERK